MIGFLLPASVRRLRWSNAALPCAVALGALASGVAAGALATGGLSGVQRAALDAYLGAFFRGLADGRVRPAPGAVLRTAFGFEAVLGGAAWFGGLTGFGLPLPVLALFLRGFTLGFTAGFLSAQEGLGGLLLAVTAMLPGSVVALPALLALGAVAIGRCLTRWTARRQPGLPARSDLVLYGVAGAACALPLLVAGCLDAYLVPPLLRALGPAFGL